MYKGPECITQVYGTRLRPLNTDPLTTKIFAAGRKLRTPDMGNLSRLYQPDKPSSISGKVFFVAFSVNPSCGQ